MPPKKTPKPGLLQFFAKQQQEKYQANQKIHNDDDSIDESCQILYEKSVPGTSKTPNFKSTPRSVTKWSETLQKSSEKTGRDWQNPFLIQVNNSKKSTGTDR